MIIGNSIAGLTAAQSIRSVDKDAQITIISDEEGPTYTRVLTTYYIGKEIDKDDMNLVSEEFYNENNIETIFGCRAEKVNSNDKVVLLDNGQTINYDRLLIATGATPSLPDVEGINKDGVFTLRSKDDATEVRNYVEYIKYKHPDRQKKAIILGGGLVCMKTATALANHGIDITFVIGSNQISSQFLDYTGSLILRDRMVKNGCKILTSSVVVGVIGTGTVKQVLLNSGETVDADMVIVGKGVNPNVELLEGTDVNIEDGIVVDEYMSTTVPDIYAAGDVAESYDIVTNNYEVNAIWPVAREEGKIAGLNMAGVKRKFPGALRMNVVEVFGVKAASVGEVRPTSEKYEEIVISNSPGDYKKIIVKDNFVAGGVFIGDNVDAAGILQNYIRQGIRIDKFPIFDQLTRGYGAGYSKVRRLA